MPRQNALPVSQRQPITDAVVGPLTLQNSATWFRAVDSTGTCVLDGNVGTAGSDLNLNSTSISVGQQVSVTSWTITAPNA